MAFKIRKRSKGAPAPVEINVTPMIDMFSVLNAFLLMTAVFSATGQQRIEVPFLSSKAPPTQQEQDKNPIPVVTVIIDEKSNSIATELGFSNNSSKVTKEKFAMDDAGLDAFQQYLYDLRKNESKFDKVTLMTEVDTTYGGLIAVLDAMRVLKPNRPPLSWPADYKLPTGVDPDSLVAKIVLGNVIL